MVHSGCSCTLQGETAEEVAGLAKAMREVGVSVNPQSATLDIVGTGGDGIGSVNISTGATVIAAAAGAKVAKHGNRSVSSLCGSADVLEVGIPASLVSESVRLMCIPCSRARIEVSTHSSYALMPQ